MSTYPLSSITSSLDRFSLDTLSRKLSSYSMDVDTIKSSASFYGIHIDRFAVDNAIREVEWIRLQSDRALLSPRTTTLFPSWGVRAAATGASLLSAIPHPLARLTSIGLRAAAGASSLESILSMSKG